MPFLDVDKIIGDRETKIIICCGSGGVGKTTTSAAIAVRAAEAGRKVVVLTIDPARRLAQSLGVGELDNTPRPVPMIDTAAGGSLDAMMLDMKGTFDDVVIAHSTPEKAEAILQNQFYVALSSEFSGTQEYMAMEKLGQLHSEAEAHGTWDLIVVDTPPARSALDFLDAPEHLSSLLDGRFLRLLLPPARGPLRLMSAGFSMMSAVDDQDPRRPDHQRRARPSSARSRHSSADSGSARRRPSSCCPRGTARSWSSRPRSMTRCARPRTSSTGSPRKACPSRAW